MKRSQFLYKFPNHYASLNDMRLKGEMCDVTIKVNRNLFHAHKLVLAAGLSYFHSMFKHSFLEKDRRTIDMKNVEETNMESLISFAYTGEILITESNALSLLEDTNYLNENGIKEACIQFLKEHLSTEKACRVWLFAWRIDCSSLEKVARQKILSHFDIISKTNDYLKLNMDMMKVLLSESGAESTVQLSKILFDGIMRWIMYDPENRRIYVCELLDFIDATNVRADYVMNYLCKIVADQDYENIEKSIMSFYRSKTNQKIGLRTQDMGLSLIIANRSGKDTKMQFYNFFKRNWSEIYKIDNSVEYKEATSVILNNQLYLYKSNIDQTEAYLEIIYFKTKRSRKIWEKIPRLCAMCAGPRYLFLCGGFETPAPGDNLYSNKIYDYDPETDIMTALTPMKFERASTAIIFHQECLYVLGGCRGKVGDDDSCKEVEKYDLHTKEWSVLAPMCERRWNFGVAILNGKLYACGGPKSRSVEVYDPSENNWQMVADMNKERWDFVVVALEGKLLAIGGDNDAESTVEVYYPDTNKWLIDRELSSGLQLRKPTGGLIQCSSIFSIEDALHDLSI